ncbi:phosphoenolpyruvate synthase [Candidatus Pacearchaeota archaeon]|nr:phosphoenolpyruvate synthase [Candidatus Pacearchaeota archaeon]
MGDKSSWVKWFSELSNKDVSIAGGKGASLAEMYNSKFPVPPGFIITAQGYDYFIEKSGLRQQIFNILSSINVEDTSQLEAMAKKIRHLIEEASMPADMKSEISEAYEVLDVDKNKFHGAKHGALAILKNSHEPPFVAVRSSATMEDLADASFAGQQESFLNVKGADSLILHVKRCFASLFTARAVYYRKKKGFASEKGYLAVVVQKMIDSQKSGVMFSKNPLKNDGNIIIEAVFGLGEGIVSGMISPDHYILSKSLEVLDRKVSDKKIALTRNSSGKTEEVKLSPEISNRDVLTSHELKVLGQYGLQLEEHYGKPQDIEFAIDRDGVFIVQSRPITTKSYDHVQEIEGNVLFSGLAASPGVASGVVKIIHSLTELNKIVKGNVLVTKMTNPDMVMAMAKSVAIITDEGGSTSHAAIVSREMGIPAVVGTHDATTKLKDGQIVTVDGFTGRIFDGKTIEKKVEIKKMLPTKKIKIKVIVDLPDYAVRAASCGADSVGLVRLETLIATGGKHPVWYIKKNKLNDYVSVLHNGLKKLSQPFHEIWIRTSDVRSDEFRNLEGSPETVEMNPMLGDHGIRFSLKNEDLLVAEFTAIKELADEYSNKIFGVMFPQIISAEELKSAKKIAERVKFPSNVKIGIMVETPAAVQVINDLCEEGMDFISFGTNDLTQYTLAIDRNNEDVQNLYTELHPAVLNSIAYVIRRCKKYGVETSVCGQAGSKPEMVKFLLREGIDSVSVNADAAYNVSVIVNELEKAVVEPVKIIKKVNGDNVVKIRRMNSQPHALESHIVHGGMMSPMRPMLHSSESNSNSQITMKRIENLGIENDDYNPGKGVTSDVPSLNDSISVSSEDFASKNSDVEVLDMSSEDIPKSDIPYEIQQDVIFDAIVGAEVASNPALQQQTMQIPGTEGMSLDV